MRSQYSSACEPLRVFGPPSTNFGSENEKVLNAGGIEICFFLCACVGTKGLTYCRQQGKVTNADHAQVMSYTLPRPLPNTTEELCYPSRIIAKRQSPFSRFPV